MLAKVAPVEVGDVGQIFVVPSVEPYDHPPPILDPPVTQDKPQGVEVGEGAFYLPNPLQQRVGAAGNRGPVP